MTVDGAAIKSGQLAFVPTKPDPKQPGATGKIAPDGSFTFQTFADADGIAEGQFDVALRPDPTLMTGVPAVKPVRVTIKANGSGGVDPVKIAFESQQGGKSTSANIMGLGSTAAPPTGMGAKRAPK